jgi:hypothetical protein
MRSTTRGLLAITLLVVCALGAGGIAPSRVSAAPNPPPPACTQNSSTFTSAEVNSLGNTTSTTLLKLVEGTTGQPDTGATNVWENNLATTPSVLLPVGAIGISSGTTGQAGTKTSPLTTQSPIFGAAWLEEAELYEYYNDNTSDPPAPASGPAPAGAPSTIKNVYSPQEDDTYAGSLLANLPNGTISHLANNNSGSSDVSDTAQGLPYVAILSSDLSTVLATVPITVTYQNYYPQLNAWMPPQAGASNQPGANCNLQGINGGDNLFSMMTFDASSLFNGANPVLQPNTTYAAYLLVRDTDVSGPLSDYLWYFDYNGPTAAVVARLSIGHTAGHTSLRWYSTAHVLGFNVYAGTRRLNAHPATSTSRWYTFTAAGRYAGSSLWVAPISAH